MKEKIFVLTLLITFNIACEDEEALDAENLVEIITELRIEDNNQPADGLHKIKVITVFPDDFDTEDDGKVTYLIFRDEVETEEIEITTTTENGKEIRKSELFISSSEVDTLAIRASISVANKSVFKETEVQFRRAFSDSINIKSSSLVLYPDDFGEIDLTTELLRKVGVVSINSYAETTVIDTLGNPRGFFNNYKTFSDSEGKVVNKFTLGNDDYLGRLYAISKAKDGQNNIQSDTIMIFSKPKE